MHMSVGAVTGDIRVLKHRHTHTHIHSQLPPSRPRTTDRVAVEGIKKSKSYYISHGAGSRLRAASCAHQSSTTRHKLVVVFISRIATGKAAAGCAATSEGNGKSGQQEDEVPAGSAGTVRAPVRVR